MDYVVVAALILVFWLRLNAIFRSTPAANANACELNRSESGFVGRGAGLVW